MSSIAVREDLSTRSDTTGDPPRWLLYALAGAFVIALGALLLSSAGVIVALTLINLTFVLAISGKIERYRRVIQAAPIFALAMTLAVSELFGLFLLNQHLLHTIGA
jgi:hypothetical protein